MPERFSLLPHAATEIASHAVPPSGDAGRLNLPYDVEIAANGGADPPRIEISAELRGPGDVESVDRSMITRIEPEPGLRGFEPSYMPFVEFTDADFPWRYTLDNSGGTRRKPWLALICLTSDEFEYVPRGNGPLSRARILNVEASLPDLEQSWAHAHVQLNLAANGSNDIADALENQASQSFARLICPRQLEPQTAYSMFLVPTYEAGRLAGLGRPPDASPFDAPAWTQDPVAINLPIYQHWSFTTDALEDLELLLRRLKAIKADEGDEPGAAKRASSANPGYYPAYSNPGASFEIQGAMRQPGKRQEGYNTDPVLADAITDTLDAVISGEGDEDDGNDPLVAFPPHGFRYKPEKAVSKSRASRNEWFDRINLDLKFRHAAGLGARVVRENQDVFAHICWTQYDDVVAANEKLARLQLSEALVKNITDKRFAKLSSDVALSLAEPIQGFVRDEAKLSVSEGLRAKGVPGSFASRALRRQAAKRTTASPSDGGGKTVPTPRIPGDLSVSVNPPAQLDLQRESTVVVGRGLGDAVRVPLTQLLGDSAFEGVSRVRTRAVTVEQFASSTLIQPMTDMLTVLPAAKAKFSVGGLTEKESAAIKPIWRAPSVHLPLADFLKDVDRNAILSDVDKMPENTVALFEENRRFIEAFMVGANHEMNNELRWREFPTDMRGTIFKRFWNRHRPPDDIHGDDIAEIHTWRDTLGRHFPPADTDKAENLIVVIRGDVVRKLGDPIMVVNVADGDAWQEGMGQDHEPVFMGKLGREIAYFGFDVSRKFVLDPANRDRVFFVIYEAVGRLRFGLDVGTAQVRRERRQTGTLGHAFPMAALQTTEKLLPHVTNAVTYVPPPPQPTNWDELSWTHMQIGPSKYVDFSKTISISGQPDFWSSGKTSASLARSFWQKPVAAVLPLARVV